DRHGALKDAEHDRIGAHVRQRERVAYGERCAAAGGFPQEGDVRSRDGYRAQTSTDHHPARESTERTRDGERDEGSTHAAAGRENESGGHQERQLLKRSRDGFETEPLPRPEGR